MSNIEKAHAGRRKAAAARRHALWAEEMRAWGWTCTPPGNDETRPGPEGSERV